MGRFSAPGILFFFASILAPQILLAQTDDIKFGFRAVLMSGGPAPGMPDGITLNSRPTSIAIDSKGKVAFVSELRGTGIQGTMQAGNDKIPNHEAMYVETNDGLVPVARLGQAVIPGQPDLQVFFLRVRSTNDGSVVGVARLGDKPRVANSYDVVFSNRGGEFLPLMETGSNVADGSLMRFDDIQYSAHNTAEQFTFRSRLLSADSPPAGHAQPKLKDARSGSTSSSQIVVELAKQLPQGLWSGTPDDLNRIAEINQPAHGIPDGFVYKNIGTLAQNPQGNIAFAARAANTNQSDSTTAIWFAKAGSEPQVFLNDITGLPAGAKITSFDHIELNSADQLVAWTGYEVKDSGAKTRGSAIVLSNDDRSIVLVKTGDLIPGTDQKVNGLSQPRLSSTGKVVVGYSFGDKRKTGLLYIDSASSDSPKLIIAQDNPAPVKQSSVTFGKIKPTHYEFITPDTVVIFNRLSDKNNAFFLSRNGGTAVPVIAKGVEIEIKPGDKRIVKTANQLFSMAGANFGESGHLPMHLRFTDRKSATVVIDVK